MNEIIETTQALLQQGKTGQALTLLIGFLEKDRRYSGFVRTLRVVEANYNRTREQDLKGLLSPQDTQRVYNQTNDTVLGILEALAAGKTAFAAPGAAARNRLPLLLGGGLGGVVLAAAIWFFIPKEQEPQCPDFKANVPKVLILPFVNIRACLDFGQDAKKGISAYTCEYQISSICSKSFKNLLIPSGNI